NTMIGLGLIGVILATFTFMYQPSEEDVKKAKQEKEKTEKLASEKDTKSETKNENVVDKTEEKTVLSADFEPKLDKNKKQIVAENGDLVYVNKLTKKDTLIPVKKEIEAIEEVEKGELIRLETDKHIFD